MMENNIRELIKAKRENRKVLIEVYSETREKTPADTVNAFVERVGYDTARIAIAELVSCVGEYDRRIDVRNRRWAESVEGAWHYEELYDHRFYTPNEIHPAHIDQIGSEMRKRDS